MKTHRPSLSEHKLARLCRWLALVLEWMLAIVFHQYLEGNGKLLPARRKAAHAKLARYRRFVMSMLILRAAPRALEMRRSRGVGPRASWPAFGATSRTAAREGARGPTHKHLNAPPGFAWRRSRNKLRSALGARLNRALAGKTIPDQIRALWRVLSDPEPFLAALTKRLARGFTTWHIVAITPPALAFSCDAPTPCAPFADSS